MKKKITCEPWRWEPRPGNNGSTSVWAVLNSRGSVVATVYSEVLARLIAATPQLFDIVCRVADGEQSDDGHTALREAARVARSLPTP